MFKFELGQKVKDLFTGFTGAVLARTEYLTGCVQYGVLPCKLKKNGGRPDCEWFDEDRLVKMQGKICIKKSRDGGPCPTPNAR